ncbi:hypothetical protein ACWDSJ_01020 [Nocardia sp. NPDC003482]
MASSPSPRRVGRNATIVLIAAGVAGTAGVSALAYAETHTGADNGSATTTTAPDATTGDSATAPQLGTGSGPAHARSNGS